MPTPRYADLIRSDPYHEKLIAMRMRMSYLRNKRRKHTYHDGCNVRLR